MASPQIPSEDKLIEVINELHTLLKQRNDQTSVSHTIIKPICPHCKVRMIQDEEGLEPPVCENPVCPQNDYNPKGVS